MAKPAHAKQKKRTLTRPPARAMKVTPTNQEAIRIVKEWMSSPPIHDKAFWDDFERELRENRFNLRRPS